METKEKPNIWLIMADQFRWDCLGIAGHPDVKTPYLDSLAAKGVLFENAFSACPSCIPARAAALTGFSQEHTRRVGYADGIEWNYPHTLAGELTKNGYQTRCIGKMHVHPLRSNQGFEEVELHDGYLHYYRNPAIPAYENQRDADDYFHWLYQETGEDITVSGAECNSWICAPWPLAEKYHPTSFVADRSMDFFRRRDRSRPFFLNSSFVRPHPPFDPPARYWALYQDKPLAPPFFGNWENRENKGEETRIFDSVFAPSDAELLRQARAGYYACITQLDHAVGQILQKLIAEKLYENTLIVFVSDHGEMLGDHGLMRKSLPYNGSMRVPLIFSGGYIEKTVKGERRKFLSELRDLLPTLLEAAGAKIPETVDGISLLPEIKKANSLSRPYLHGEHNGVFPYHTIVTQRDKYIWFADSGREQYFLANDKEEKENGIAVAGYQERIGELRGILIRELKNRPEGFTDGERLIAGRPYSPMIPN